MGVSYSPTQTGVWLQDAFLSGQQVTVAEGIQAILSHIYRLLLTSLHAGSPFFTVLHRFSSLTEHHLKQGLQVWSCISIFCCV